MDARIDKNRIYCNCLLTILGSEQWTPNAGGDYEENNLKKFFTNEPYILKLMI